MSLTPSESRIIRMMCLGMSLEEIAQALVLSKRTVDFHAHNLYRKLGASNQIKACFKAWKLGICPLPEGP